MSRDQAPASTGRRIGPRPDPALAILLAAGAAIPGWGGGGGAVDPLQGFPTEPPPALERTANPGRAFVVDGLQVLVLDTAWASSFQEASDLPWALQGFERLRDSRWGLDTEHWRIVGLFGNEIGDAHLQELESEGYHSNRTPVLGVEAILRRKTSGGEAQMRAAFDQNDESSSRTEYIRAERSGSAKVGGMSWFGENTPFQSALGGGVLLARGGGSLRADARSGWWWTTSPASGDLVPWRGAEGAACLRLGSFGVRATWMEWRTAGEDRRGRWAVGDGEVEAWGQGGGLEWRARLAARTRELSWPGRVTGGREITFPAALALAFRHGDRLPRRIADGDPVEGRDASGGTESGAEGPPQGRCSARCVEAGIDAQGEGGFVELRPRIGGEAALGEGALSWSATAFLRRGRRVPQAWELLLAPGEGRAPLLAQMAPDESRLGGDLAVGYRLEAGALALECASGLAWEDGAPFFAPDSFIIGAQGLGMRSGRWARAPAYVAPRGRLEARFAPLPAAAVFASVSVRDAWGRGADRLEHLPARTQVTGGLRGRLPSDLAYEGAITHVGDKSVRGWKPDGTDFRVPAHWEGRFGLAQSALDGRLQLSLSALNAFGREILEHPQGNEVRFRILVAVRYAI